MDSNIVSRHTPFINTKDTERYLSDPHISQCSLSSLNSKSGADDVYPEDVLRSLLRKAVTHLGFTNKYPQYRLEIFISKQCPRPVYLITVFQTTKETEITAQEDSNQHPNRHSRQQTQSILLPELHIQTVKSLGSNTVIQSHTSPIFHASKSCERLPEYNGLKVSRKLIAHCLCHIEYPDFLFSRPYKVVSVC